MEEIWKRLIYNGEDYGDFYFVSNLGRIKNLKTNNILKGSIGKSNPYRKIILSFGSDKPKKTIMFHRAVACTFIPNPENLPYVNHKDGNKLKK